MMAYGGIPNHTDMADLSTSGSSTMATTTSAHEEAGAALAHDLVHQLGQFSLDSSPVLPAKAPKFARKYSLRELEIQQTIGECSKLPKTECCCEGLNTGVLCYVW